MLQSDRTWLFNKAYWLDNLSRLYLPAKDRDGLKVVKVEKVEKLRMQGTIDDLAVVFSEKQLADLAEELRELAARDEDRIARYDSHSKHR
jgi:hypothetical protein